MEIKQKNIYYPIVWIEKKYRVNRNFCKTSLNAYNSKTIPFMTFLMTFLEKLENFELINVLN